MNRTTATAFAAMAALAAIPASALAQGKSGEQAGKTLSADAKRGRYLVQTSGCNDCHTPGYAQNGGKVDEKLWLTGDALGWRGPWGTTYASNLRLAAANMSERQWVLRATSPQLRPPMPWFNLRDMAARDLKAIHAYLKHLGPAGDPAPAYLPPDATPNGPFVQFPAPPPAKGGAKN